MEAQRSAHWRMPVAVHWRLVSCGDVCSPHIRIDFALARVCGVCSVRSVCGSCLLRKVQSKLHRTHRHAEWEIQMMLLIIIMMMMDMVPNAFPSTSKWNVIAVLVMCFAHFSTECYHFPRFYRIRSHVKHGMFLRRNILAALIRLQTQHGLCRKSVKARCPNTFDVWLYHSALVTNIPHAHSS